jgi:predicted phage terminase large subunit-like protein
MKLPSKEEVNRELAERSLSEFIRQAWRVIEPDTEYLHNWHIDAIAEHLEAVSRGEITRLLINIPPRYMKSIGVTVMWPCWEWVRKPHLRYLFASYSGDLSTEHSMLRRAIISSAWYQGNWGDRVTLAKDQNEKTEFKNTSMGVMTATSIGGTATGKGGNRIIIDDPHNPKQAESDVEREAAVLQFRRTFTNRLNDKKRDAIVVVMQRLHQSDVAGYCVEMGYTHLCLPGEYEPDHPYVWANDPRTQPGELLWPEREADAEIEDQKKNLGSYGFAGQYQQRPSPREGGMFKPHWFEIVSAAPAKARRVRYWDLAASQNDGDYSSGVLVSKTDDGIYYIEDVQRGQLSSHNAELLVKQTAEIDSKATRIYMEQEPGSSGKAVISTYTRILQGYPFRGDRVTGPKEVRADPFAAQCEAGNVKLVKGAWNREYLEELALFPNGDHDDQVDASSGAFDKLANSRFLTAATRI